MTERIFRGKELKTDRWVFGSLLIGAYSVFICWEVIRDKFELHKVNPLTVGVSSSYEDIDGTVLFEGDIVVSGHGFEYLLVLDKNGIKAQSKLGFRYELEDIYHPKKLCVIHDTKEKF